MGLAISIVGCGAGTSTPPVAPNPQLLNGNWMLVGSLPFLSPLQTAGAGFGVAMTFSVVGDQIVGSGTFQAPCGQSAPTGGSGLGLSVSIGGGVVLAGSVAKDDTFTAQTSATQPAQLSALQLTGTIPSTAGGPWQGNFNFSSNNSSCPYTGSGVLNAVRIADLTGTYTGSGSFAPPSGSSPTLIGSSQPVSLTFTFQQGQVTPATQSVNEGVFTGSVQVQGASCFSSGQVMAQSSTQPQLQSSLLGSNFLASFTMDDGSQLMLTGNIEDVASSKIGVVGLLVKGGKCDGQFIEPFELTRQ